MKTFVRISGFALAAGLDGWLIFDKFISVQEVGTEVKIGFAAVLALFVGFLVGWSKINKVIGRKLQAVQTAKELGVVGQTALWWTTALEWGGILVPLSLLGALFYFVGTYFNDIGQTILTMTATLTIPMATSLIYKVIERNELIQAEQNKQEALIKGVAEEVKKVVYQ